MATAAYLSGRKKYGRPQAIMFSENPGTLVNTNDGSPFYVPVGFEVGQNLSDPADLLRANRFLILSDHNRQPIDFKITRIEKRERTINGRMRSYHIADKRTFSTSWNDIPSRAFSTKPNISATGEVADGVIMHTVDGGAGGTEMLEWYSKYKGSFWMFLSYDQRPVFGESAAAYQHLNQYQEVVEVYISDFSYTVNRRGNGTNAYDLWNVTISLEEA